MTRDVLIRGATLYDGTEIASGLDPLDDDDAGKIWTAMDFPILPNTSSVRRSSTRTRTTTASTTAQRSTRAVIR